MQPRRAVDFVRVNGLLGDPAIYAFFQKTGNAVLFDLGNLERLPSRDLLRVRLVLVSHTHIDHFIGFDRLLRLNIPHGREIQLVGPPGFAANVQGKLRGYLWNLISADQLRFVVHEVAPDGTVTSVNIGSEAQFTLVPTPTPKPVLTPLDPPLRPSPLACIGAPFDDLRIEAVALDHKTPSIAYAVQQPCRFHVREEALLREGLTPGPWIRETQIALANREADREIAVGGRTWRAGDLGAVVFEARAPRPLGYMTDAGFTRSNLERAAQLMAGVDVLVCETNYRDAEAAKARDRMHLTTRQAALIAATAGVRELDIFHVSSIYAADPEGVAEEAAGFFAAYRALAPEALAAAVDAELART